jgi:ParD-like antitoxin of type II bacterial toxin-antitoxin system
MPAPRKKKAPMSIPVRFGENERSILKLLRARAAASDRSVSGQLKHYARLAMIAEDNPDLPLPMIQGILDAQAELRADLAEPYWWGGAVEGSVMAESLQQCHDAR